MPKEQSPGKPTTRRYSEQEKDAAVRMVRTLRTELGNDHGTVQRVARQLGHARRVGAAVGAPGRDRRRPCARGEHRRGHPDEELGAGEPRAAPGRRDPQAGGVFLRGGARPPAQEGVAFIDANRHELGVEPICQALQVAPSTYYAAKARRPSARARRDEVTGPALRALWEDNYRVYGARKLWKAACRADLDVGRDQVARLGAPPACGGMREMGIEGARRTKWVRTTRADPAATRHPDLVNRDFPPQAGGAPTAAAPNQLWVTDLTYVPTWAGVAYVCFIVDACSRAIVGWRAASHMRTGMVLDAIEMARCSRGTRLVGLRCHSDAGAQFTSLRYGERLAEIGATPSIGTVADSYDNALAETVNGYYKAELIRGPARRGPWTSVEDVELATLGWVHWHNTARLHGYLDDVPPAEFEATFYAATGSDPLEVELPTLEPL